MDDSNWINDSRNKIELNLSLNTNFVRSISGLPKNGQALFYFSSIESKNELNNLKTQDLSEQLLGIIDKILTSEFLDFVVTKSPS